MTKNKQSIIAVSGLKNSGKTTLIERIIPELKNLGIGVAVIKHDGHTFMPDVPNTDTYRHFMAGAEGTAIFDGEKFMAVKRMVLNEISLCQLFPDVDLILLEGFKYSDYQKIELVLEEPICNEETVLAYVSDTYYSEDKTTFHRDEIQKIAEFLAERIRYGRFL